MGGECIAGLLLMVTRGGEGIAGLLLMAMMGGECIAGLLLMVTRGGEGIAGGAPYGSSVSGGTKVRIIWGRTPQVFFMGLLRPTRYRAKRKELHLLHFLHLSRNAKLSTID